MSVACRLLQDLPNIARLAGLGPEFRSRPGRGTVIQQSRPVMDEGPVVLDMKSTIMVAKRV
jgi:hypothetical protein